MRLIAHPEFEEALKAAEKYFAQIDSVEKVTEVIYGAYFFSSCELFSFVQSPKHLAGLVKLRTFRRHPRGLKKAQPKRTYLKNKPHVSTAKILTQKKLQNNTP